MKHRYNVSRQELVDLYKTLSLSGIAKHYGVTKTTISRWFVKHNISRIAPGYTKLCLERFKTCFTNDIKKFIVGSLLGDGHISLNNSNKAARFEVRHSTKQFEYVKWKREILSGYVGDITFNKAVLENKTHFTCGFKSYSHPEFMHFRNLFYKDNIKYINPEIEKYLDDFSMAIWLMDDGTFKKAANKIILCTNCFSLEDHEILRSMIKAKLGINTKISRIKDSRYNLYFNVKESKEISEIVMPYIIESMRYKLSVLN
jgi:hypothetical protein